MFNCLTIFVIVAIAVTVGLVLSMVVKGRKGRTICRLEISNLGNVKSRYDLRAQDPAGALKFRFTLDGIALPQRQVVSAMETAGQVSPIPASVAAASSDDDSDAEPATQSISAGNVSSFAGGIADLLYAFGYLLPRSVGEPLLQLGSRLRQGQYTAYRAQQARDQAAYVATSVPGRKAQRAAPISTVTSPAPPAAVPAATQAVSSTAPMHVWVQSPFVEPGETCTVDLHIEPVRVLQPQPMDCAFKVMSRSVDQQDAPWTTDEWTVRVDSLAALSRNTPLLIVLGVVVVGLILAAAFCVNSAGILGP
jgi:hypothetical protein